ncbi:MAG: hypothetical protein NZ750_10045 [Anaerolineae bacterium]|nr:hypothetical protein [Anaerolineae bacterium]MDW8172623.1 hypothetical protein [Anaerolineae bacterium]
MSSVPLSTIPVKPIHCLALLLALLSACQEAAQLPSTPIAQVRSLATAFISPTPNADELRATQAAISPTPTPPTPTITPSPTAYVGLFIGRAELDGGFVPARAPLFANLSGEPTAEFTCQTPIDPNYLRLWQRNPDLSRELACPIQAAYGWQGSAQIFERGVMYDDPSTRSVWAIAPGQRRVWIQEAPPALNPAPLLGPGAIIPQGDIGSLWAGVEALRLALGAPQTEAIGISLGIQRMEGGTFLYNLSSGQIYAFSADGRLLGTFNPPRPDELPTPFSPLVRPTAASALPAQGG